MSFCARDLWHLRTDQHQRLSRLPALLTRFERQEGGRLGAICSVHDELALAQRPSFAVLPANEANAGAARRHAMDLAAARLDEGGDVEGVLMTTDADSRVAPDWVASNLAVIDAGVDAVAGTICLEPDDEAILPRALKARGALGGRYETLVCKLETMLDPLPHDPWPRHPTESGASLALTLASFRAIGGVPHKPLGEDRALVAALRHHGFLVRHSPDVKVMTSGRLFGRAEGGCADTMQLRIVQPDAFCDEYLRPAFDVLHRRTSPTSPASQSLRPDELRGEIRTIQLIITRMSALHTGRAWIARLAGQLKSASTNLTQQAQPGAAQLSPLNPDENTATP